MTHADLQRVRTLLAGMEAVLERSHGGAADDDALLEFRRHCWAALLLTDDPECHEQIDQLVQYAKDLYSERENHRVDLLRGKINLFGLDSLVTMVAAMGARIELKVRPARQPRRGDEPVPA